MESTLFTCCSSACGSREIGPTTRMVYASHVEWNIPICGFGILDFFSYVSSHSAVRHLATQSICVIAWVLNQYHLAYQRY